MNTVRESASADRGDTATKGDLAGLEGRVDARLAELRADIAGVQADVFRALWIQGGVLLASQVAIAGFIVSMVTGGGQ